MMDKLSLVKDTAEVHAVVHGCSGGISQMRMARQQNVGGEHPRMNPSQSPFESL